MTVRCVGAVLSTPTSASMAIEHFPREATAAQRRAAIEAAEAQLRAEPDAPVDGVMTRFNFLHADDVDVHWPNRTSTGAIIVRTM